MGIKGFRSWFESQFPDAISGIPLGTAREDFDHVLIDMNQLLHIVLRKSRSEGHCFTMLMQELDACVALATPRQSLVLAMDGPPGAAKLATQRRRRFGVVLKTAEKVAQLDRLLATVKGQTSKRALTRAKQWTRKKRRALAETRTLCITPATDFMAQAEQAILYWAWQRLSARHTALAVNDVKVFISPSTVPGEGEVKLLEWIYTKKRRGESVAILGGDSDLVLEALVVPVASTHNVFVLLPDGNKRYLSVSLWEATRTLGRYLPHVTTESVIKVRTDLVLLLILNGNDYLPKLRGSSGFNKLFHTYLRLQREWHSSDQSEAFLVDPDTLQFNLEFCIAFFGRLAAMAPANLWSKDKAVITDRNSPLQQLNNMMESGFLPAPMKYMVIRDDDGDDERLEVNATDEDYDDDDDDDVDDDDENSHDDDDEEEADGSASGDNDEGEQILVRLLLGEPGSEDFYTYEIWHPRGSTLKKARQKLAAIALTDLMDEQSSDTEDEADEGLGITSAGYEWEIHHTVEGKVEPYLYGLLWKYVSDNESSLCSRSVSFRYVVSHTCSPTCCCTISLQTYQDGVCADYSYNYGKRLSPLAKEIKQFFEAALKETRAVGPRDLQPAPFSPPVSAGLSCLAALPSPVKYLVPEPYRSLADESVEEFYASCMDPDDNVFDIKKFERLCEGQIRSMQSSDDECNSGKPEKMPEPHDGRRIIFGDHYWTVVAKVPKALAHPFEPPAPFSDRLAKLKPNDRIRVSRFMATAAPRPRSVWDEEESPSSAEDNFVDKDSRGFSHSDPGVFLGKLKMIEQVDYRVAYQKNKKKERKGLRNGKVNLAMQVQFSKTTTANKEKAHGATIVPNLGDILVPSVDINSVPPLFPDVESRMKHYNIQAPLPEPTKNADGATAMAVLKQLSDVELIGPIQVSIYRFIA